MAKGASFAGGLRFTTTDSVCLLWYQRNCGDIWMFMILMDRLPVLVALALVYLGFRVSSSAAALVFLRWRCQSLPPCVTARGWLWR